jgi:hypothetical protein
MAASALAYVLAQNDATSIAGSLGAFWLSDDFESDSLAVKTNATYDATNDKYHNPGDRLPTATDFTGGTSSVTLTPDGTVTPTASNWSIYDNTNLISGDFDCYFTWTTKGSTGGTTGIGIGFILDSATGSFSSGGVGFGLSGSNIPFNLINTVNTIEARGDDSAEATITVSNGNVVRITRESGTFKVYVGASYAAATLQRTMTATTTADLRLAIGCNSPGSYDDIDAFTFVGTVGDMTLEPSDATLTTANPTDLLAYFVIDPGTADFDTNGDAGAGDDIIGKMSIDSGSTLATGTWTKVGDIGSSGEELWRLEADVSGQTGSALMYQITTQNTETVELHDCVGVVAIY